MNLTLNLIATPEVVSRGRFSWGCSLLQKSSGFQGYRYKTLNLFAQGMGLGLIGLLVAVSPVLADETAEIQATFADYKSAILAGRGDEAVDQLSQNTIEYYGAMQKLAVCADAATVKAEPMLNRVQVFSLRFRVEPQTLLKFSDREVIAYGVEQGWIGRDGVTDIEVGQIALEKGEAFAEMTRSNQPTGIRFRFVEESGNWKLDLVPIIEFSNLAFQELAKQ
ncbi:MAG: hypothetical protein HC835_13260 [Oscillatoriales cyanobacterium RM2_1_1]|nr:hypothetical protein [Oscillatoriales cyanobacterium RM2_1_1]